MKCVFEIIFIFLLPFKNDLENRTYPTNHSRSQFRFNDAFFLSLSAPENSENRKKNYLDTFLMDDNKKKNFYIKFFVIYKENEITDTCMVSYGRCTR